MNQAVVSADAGSKQSRNQLVLAHIEYVDRICAGLVGGLPEHADIPNLKAAGMVGLVEAAHRFDESKGISFSTFSYPRIRGAIVDELRKNSRIPQRTLKAVRQVREALARLAPPVTVESLMEETGLSIREISDCRQAMRLVRPCPLDESEVRGDWDPPDARLQKAERQQLLLAAISGLNRRQRLVVQMYYLDELRLREIGQILGVSESCVSKTLDKAETRLRQAMAHHECS